MDKDLVISIAESLAKSKSGWGEPSFLDAGASGGVFSLKHPDQGTVALKIYDPKFFVGENALIEEHRVKLQCELAHLDHPHLIRTIEAAPIPEHGTWHLLMEYCPWPSLEKVIQDLPDHAVPALIRQLAEVTIFLRENGLVHRDIKPSNIAVSPDFTNLKLLDLGVLRKISPDEGNGTDLDEKRRFVATTQYSPPEYVTREEPPGEEGFEALNVYQVGAVLHDMLMKRPLFGDEANTLNRFVLYKAVLQKGPTVFNSGVPARLNSLCRAALRKNALSRARGVKLEDFIAAADDAATIRRRLAAGRRSRSAPSCPSVLVWKGRVEDWIASAAGAEKDILGAMALREVRSDVGCEWELSFVDHDLRLRVSLGAGESGDHLDLSFGPIGDTAGVIALEIYPDGPNIPREQIKAQLNEQMLFALDSLPSDSSERIAPNE
jgi:serine/threonine-protein kinase